MTKWEKVTLAECCHSITDGDHQSMPVSEYGVPFIIISNIKNNRIDFEDTRFVPSEYYDSLDVTRKAQRGDILYTVKGSFGIPAYVDSDMPFVFQRDIAILKCNNKVNSKFLYYIMKSVEFERLADLLAIGSAQRAITLKTLRGIEIMIPEKSEQDRIVNILSPYDDLIENNQKQIKLLEEAAQRLYKEWFVDLRFPGHEDVQIVDGVPVGWKVGRADEFFDITIGKTPPRAEKKWFVNGSEGVAWASISDMGDAGTFIFNTAEGITTEAVEKHNMKVVPKGTILLSFKLTLGRVSITTKPMCTNEAIAHFLICKPEDREYTYSYLKNFEYDTLGNTSSISKAVNSKIIKAMPFIMPGQAIVKEYSTTVSPILDQIFSKQAAIIKLTEARDRLLPKLMSGEIEL